MYEIHVTVLNKYGIHARPSARIVKEALKYESSIKITNIKENIVADAKGALELLLLRACCGTELLVSAEGKDEKEAVENLVNLIKRFSEDPELNE